MNGLLHRINSFFYRGIHLLLEKWEKVIASVRRYFEYNLIKYNLTSL